MEVQSQPGLHGKKKRENKINEKIRSWKNGREKRKGREGREKNLLKN